MLPDKLHAAITALERADNLLTILHERVRRTANDPPSEELALTIRDGLTELKEMLLQEEHKLHTP
jgi:hypothetical protein